MGCALSIFDMRWLCGLNGVSLKMLALIARVEHKLFAGQRDGSIAAKSTRGD